MYFLNSLICIIFIGIILFFERKLIAISQKRLSISFLGRNGWIHIISDLFKFWFKTINRHENIKNFSLLILLSIFLIWNLLSIIFFLSYNFNSFFFIQEYKFLYYICYCTITNIFFFILINSLKSKYALIASFRTLLLIIFFEVPFTFMFLLLYFLISDYNFNNFLFLDTKLILISPILFIILLIYILVESKRAPFDHTESESELVAGHLIEFGGRTLFIFFLCEYVHFFFIIFLGYIFFINSIYITYIFSLLNLFIL